MENYEIHHLKQIQHRLRHANYLEFRKVVLDRVRKQGAQLGSMFIAPPTFLGSNRHMEKGFRQLNAMIRKFGKPQWFLTVTSNPRWVQLIECLKAGENTYDDASDLLMRVWMDVKDEIIKDIKERGVFGKVVAIFYSIEYQKRGGPHIHMIIWTEDDLTPALVDEYTTAEFMPEPPVNVSGEQAEQMREIFELQKKMQIHRCDKRCLRDRPDGNGKRCEARYPYDYCYQTELGRGEYAKLMRRPPPPEGVTIPSGHECLYSREVVCSKQYPLNKIMNL